MELSDIFRSFRRNWLVAAFAFAAVFAVGLAAAYLPSERFSATATLLVEPVPERAQNLQVVPYVMPSIAARVQSRSFQLAAAERVRDDVDSAPVGVRASADPATGVLSITASSTNRKAVAPWANAFARHLVDQPPSRDFLTLAVLDPALAPLSPSSPVRRPILLSAGLLGAIAAVFAAVAAGSLRGRLDAPEEIRRRFGTSVLGEIPAVRGAQRLLANPQLLFSSGPPELVEAYQYLRTNLELLVYSKRPEAIAITSSAAGEGKSTVTANLGWALAAVGHKVTLIDADLRQPALHRCLDRPLGPGVNVASAGDVAQLVHPTAQPNLRLVTAGVPNRHPAEVVGASLPVLLEALAGPDRLVLIDSPPLNGVAETPIIAAMAKSVVLVIDSRRRDFVDIERTLYDLREKGAEILGVIINRARIRRSRSPGHGYVVRQGPQEKVAVKDGADHGSVRQVVS